MSNLKEHILDTALKLFLQKSFKDVTMKELVDFAGISKGAFYHYFTSKEKVFEEVVLRFYDSLQVKDYKILSEHSLYEFYKNGLKIIGESKNFGEQQEFTLNHYYLIFDGMKLIPRFKEIHLQQTQHELNEWSKIIAVAKEKKEIESILPDETIAKMFLFLLDGSMTNAIINGNIEQVKEDISILWDGLYDQLKRK